MLEVRDLSVAYGGLHALERVTLSVAEGRFVTLVGPNGAGKSTLLRILAGTLPFDGGARRLGHAVRVGFFAQHQLEALDPTRTVLEEIASVARLEDVPRLRGQLGAFLFSGDDVEKKVGVLSGGEKARLALAKMLLRPANLLVLDEPTNHLDVEACEVLEEGLREWEGTLVVISHDRAFLNAVATRVVEVRAGRLREFPGNYDAYFASLAAAERPEGRGAVSGHGTPHLEDGRPGAAAAAAAPPGREARRASREEERERRKARERAARRIGELEAAILERERALEAIGWRLADPALWREVEQALALEAERSATQAALEALYREWERLAAEVEALDQALAPPAG